MRVSTLEEPSPVTPGFAQRDPSPVGERGPVAAG